jgi:hypothetical protein
LFGAGAGDTAWELAGLAGGLLLAGPAGGVLLAWLACGLLLAGTLLAGDEAWVAGDAACPCAGACGPFWVCPSPD